MKLDELLPSDLFVTDGARSAALARVNGAVQSATVSGYAQGLQAATQCPVARYDGTLRTMIANLHAQLTGAAPQRLARR